LTSRHSHDDHDHTHLHGPKNFGFAFAVGTLLNVGLVAAQFLYGIHAHSIALIADAGHNLGDALGLLLAWGAHILARWEPTDRYTYGFRSASILAALVNAAILLIATPEAYAGPMRRREFITLLGGAAAAGAACRTSAAGLVLRRTAHYHIVQK
jgi:cobalt-zinc-cadmium efflux system protein